MNSVTIFHETKTGKNSHLTLRMDESIDVVKNNALSLVPDDNKIIKINTNDQKW